MTEASGTRSKREGLHWDGRLPWFCVSLAAMTVSLMHIIIDFGVGLFDIHGTLAPTEFAVLVGIILVQVWWVLSLVAGSHGSGGGILSTGVLGAIWSGLTNGYPIVYCPPVCHEAAPLTDIGHVGSIVFGILTPLVAIWTLWRLRIRPGIVMPLTAAALAIGTVVSLANTPIAN